MPQTIFFVQMDVQVMTWLQKEATTPPPSVNLYPKGGNPGKKGRESCSRHPEISTQKVEITEIGRESKSRRL